MPLMEKAKIKIKQMTNELRKKQLGDGEAGLNYHDSSIQQAANYLLSKQQNVTGEWYDQEMNIVTGGWGFSENNKINPDVDDTQAALRTIHLFSDKDKVFKHAWNRGVNWLLAMQNNDGGRSAFNRNTYKKWLTYLPVENMEDAVIDPSTSDITGRTLEFLGKNLRLNLTHPRVEFAVNWLLQQQNINGTWSSRWGISYIYGTWAAITGLRSVGIPSNHPAIQKEKSGCLLFKILMEVGENLVEAMLKRNIVPYTLALLLTQPGLLML